ncbi:MAG: hypothetical protein IJN67_14965 [Oscillospiraceae bacterium]|nr:hypothetical protein [Oscillospiraceae bacterium]
MKNHSNRILVVFFAASVAVNIGLFLVRAVAFPFEIYGAIEICAFYFPAVPFLFLQMLLCKVVQKKWVRFLPLLAVAIVAMVAAVGCATASGWDTLGYLILLLLCIGPALGCIIGFVADRLWRKRDYAVSARSYVFMVAFPLLVFAAAIFTDWHGNLGARSMYDIPSKESVVAAFEEGTYTVDSNDLIGYNRDQLREIWGEPDSMLSGFWGDRWAVDDGTNMIVYYAADGKIEYAKIDTNSAYDNNRAAVTIEGEIYYVVGDPIYFEFEEIEAMTFLEHAIPYIESKPEAGYYDPDLEMKYAKVDEGIVVLYMDKWYLCVPADSVLSD